MKRFFFVPLILLSLTALTPALIKYNFSETEYSLQDEAFTDYVEVDKKISHLPEEVVTAYNSINNEYLVVWHEAGNYDHAIFAQRVSATTGKSIGEKIAVSLPKSVGDLGQGNKPSVAYDPVSNRFLIVWATTNAIMGQTIGQFIDGASGAKVGDVFIIGNGFAYDKDIDRIYVLDTKILYNPHLGEFLVAWTGRAEYSLNISDYQVEVEIFAAKVNPVKGVSAAARISKYGAEKDGFSRTTFPSMTYNSRTNQYAFVFFGYYQSPIEHTIFGQIVNAGDLSRTMLNDKVLHHASLAHISHTSDLNNPEIFYNAATNEYLLARQGSAIFLERLNANLDSLSTTNLNLTGLSLEANLGSPYTMIYRASHNQIFFAWTGKKQNTSSQKLKSSDFIYGQLVDANTAQLIGVKNFRITQALSDPRIAPAASVDINGNLFVAFIQSYRRISGVPETINVLGKIFTPFLQDRQFTYTEEDPPVDDGGSGGSGGENTAVTTTLSKAKQTAEFRQFLASCSGTAENLGVRIYTSANAVLEMSKDKVLKSRKFKAKRKSLKIKLQNKGRLPKYLIAECMSGEVPLSSTSIKVK